MRLGELRRQHYVLAGVVGAPDQEEPARPSAVTRGGTSRKPPLAQKPSLAPKQDHQVGPPGVRHRARMGGPWGVRPGPCSQVWGRRALGRSEVTDRQEQSAVPAARGEGSAAPSSRGRCRGPGLGRHALLAMCAEPLTFNPYSWTKRTVSARLSS